MENQGDWRQILRLWAARKPSVQPKRIVPEKRPSMIVENCRIAWVTCPCCRHTGQVQSRTQSVQGAPSGTLSAVGPWRIYIPRDLLGRLNLTRIRKLDQVSGFTEWKNPSPALLRSVPDGTDLRRAPSPQGRGLDSPNARRSPQARGAAGEQVRFSFTKFHAER